jgi:hypothetical protein
MVGTEVGLIKTTLDGLSRKKSFKVWNKRGPGAWLTHGSPGGVAAQVSDGDQNDVAAVAQAEAAG